MTTQLKRCKTCTGRKHFMGLGGVGKRDCTTCKGIGYVEVQAPQEIIEDKPTKRAYTKRKQPEEIVEVVGASE